jgi:hypothetical protein
MKNGLVFLNVLILMVLPSLLHGQPTRETYYSVTEVYTNTTINEGDTIQVAGYYTDTTNNYLLDFYGDIMINSALPPHSLLTMTGILPPTEAWNGGYIHVLGIINFEDDPDYPYHPEDSLMAFLNAISITVCIPGDYIPASPGDNIPRHEQYKKIEPGNNKSMNTVDCDPCKFGFLLSGGINEKDNWPKYWESLVALYKFKVDSLGYCDSNMFVHYYDGTPKDGRIPAGRVFAATNGNIDNSFQVIADRVAACKANGDSASLQKMITNHGEEDGDINLVGNDVLTPDHLKDLEQKVIDSCCKTLENIFLQCYAGFVVDTLKTLDIKNKTTVHLISSADKGLSVSDPDKVDPFLKGYIESLDGGNPVSAAATVAKIAYDNYLQQTINMANNEKAKIDANDKMSPDEKADKKGEWNELIAACQNGICHSRNVTLVPFTHYCEWQQFVVPPGGQLVLDFSENGESCSNVTVYSIDPFTGQVIKVTVWNWNNPGSDGYEEGNDQRVINGNTTSTIILWVHNDNDTTTVTGSIMGDQALPESPSNVYTYANMSFGGDDQSNYEFEYITESEYFIPLIDQLYISLDSLPAVLGLDYVENFGFSFIIDTTSAFWSDMQLIINVLNINSPGTLMIFSPHSTIQESEVYIDAPGEYIIPLGDFTQSEMFGMISMSTIGDLQIGIDSWGLRTAVTSPPPLISMWIGYASSEWNNPENWSNGVPGMHYEVTIMPGLFQPVITTDVIIKSMTIMEGAAVITAPEGYLILTGE